MGNANISFNKMNEVPPPGSVVVADWHRCKDSKEYFSKILNKKKRKKFGMFSQAPRHKIAICNLAEVFQSCKVNSVLLNGHSQLTLYKNTPGCK